MNKKIRVMVVDDHDFTRGGIARTLRQCSGIDIVAETIDGVDAIQQALDTKPDIAVIDVSMPRLSGLEAVHGIHSILPRCKLLVVTTAHDDEYVVPIVKAGASGYLLKEKLATELDDAIRALSAGDVYFGQTATRILAERLAQEDAQGRPS